MEERINLMVSPLDSMHDQMVNSIEIINNDLLFYYNELRYSDNINKEYHSNHSKFSRCVVTFKDIDVPYIEIKAKNKLKTKIRVYYLDEFLVYMKRKDLGIQTLYFYTGYNTAYIDAILINKKTKREYNCYIIIPATEVLYNWQ